MTARLLEKFGPQVEKLVGALAQAKRVLLTAPGAADGDSVGSQLALRYLIRSRFPQVEVAIVNDEPFPPRYLFLPGARHATTPDSYALDGKPFDVAILVDGGIDRTGRTREAFHGAACRVFIDHHAVSAKYSYDVRIVDETASSTTEMVWYLSQHPALKVELTSEFAQLIYLGLVFDTGFFRHSNTTPEAMELGAKLIRTGFDFTQVGERGMLSRTFPSLKLLSDTLRRAELVAGGKIIWSSLSQKTMVECGASADDREGIIDQLFLTEGIELALLFLDMGNGETKLSLRSQGPVDVAEFARSLTERGGGHRKAAGANFSLPLDKAVSFVLKQAEALVGGERAEGVPS